MPVICAGWIRRLELRRMFLVCVLLFVPLGPGARAQSPPAFSKIVVIMLENTEYDEIIGNPSAPFFNDLASQYGLADNYFGITHPSLPNYIATVAGDTMGINDNCEDLSICHIPDDFPSNVVDQVEESGRSWIAYMEALPEPCAQESSYPYAQKHNPFIYFDTIRLQPERCVNIAPH